LEWLPERGPESVAASVESESKTPHFIGMNLDQVMEQLQSGAAGK
jgi:hypothetical protein